jgi:hypothetical protein
MGELPAASLADEIETPGAGQIHALVTLAGNPVLSSPAGHRLSDALEKLDFMVAIDFYLNETTRHADLILPPVGPLERDHFDLAFALFSVRNVARWSPAALPRPPQGRSDAEILLELARRLQRARGAAGRLRAALHRAILALGADRVARWLIAAALRGGSYGRLLPGRRGGITLRKLRRSLHGVDLGPLQPALPERLPNPRRRVDLMPSELLEEVERLHGSVAETPPELLVVHPPRRRGRSRCRNGRLGQARESRRVHRGARADHGGDSAWRRLPAAWLRSRP